MKTLRKFLLGGSLSALLILLAASILQAQSATLSQSDVGQPTNFEDSRSTPEPVTVLVFGIGLVGVGAMARRLLVRNEA